MKHVRTHHALLAGCPLLSILTGVLLMSVYPAYGPWIAIPVGLLAMVGLYGLRPRVEDITFEQFGEVFATAPTAHLITSLEGVVVWANEAALELLQTNAADLIGQALDTAIAAPWADLLTGEQALLEGESITFEGPVQLPGEPLWITGFASLIKDDLERPRMALLQLINRSVERNAAGSGRRAESRLRQIMQASPDTVLLLDRHGRIRQANPKASVTLGFPSEALIGNSILEFIPSSQRTNFIESLKERKPGDCKPLELPDLELSRGGVRNASALTIAVEANLIRLGDEENADTLLTCRNRSRSEPVRDVEDDRFSRIFHSSPDAILIIRHEDRTILDFNAGFTRLLGYTREQAIGSSEQDLGLWPDAEGKARDDDQMTSAECTGREVKLNHRDGETVHVELSLRYIEIAGDLCSLCIARDVSKRVRAERQLRESEDKFERVFAQSPDGIVILRRSDLTIYDINRAFLNSSGYAREELLGQSVTDLEVLSANAELQEATALLDENGYFANREMLFRSKSGNLVPSLVSATIIDLKGEPYVLCIAKDVEALRTTERQLRQSEQRFRGAFENAPIGILLLDLEGTVFQANRFAQELLDYDDNDLDGLHISRLVPAEDRPQLKELFNSMALGRQNTVRREQRLTCQNGAEIWTNFHAVLQRTESSEPAYCIVQIADVTELKTNSQRMERMAFYDTLTDLANRRLFNDRLGHAISHCDRSDRLAALLYLDLDQFKRVNDTLGHETGDMLLQEVGVRLTQCVRHEDTVGRPGGDEFTVLLYDIGSPTDATTVAEKILQALRQPISIAGHQLVVTPSIGVTIIPEDGTDPNVLMKNADLAMYRAKEHGRNNYQFYSEEMNTNAVKRLRTEYELSRALERDEFELYYQPKIRLTDQQVVGMECLIRWQHPERGLLSPVEFIDVAEETGFIVELGSWIIERACHDGKLLSDFSGEPLQIAVNISPRQFRDPNLISTIRRSLRQSGLAAECLEIEITETMLMHDVGAANEVVNRLHELGVRLAIDDFGTGYSSLSYLKKFPIDTVKVDRSFVMDIPDSADDMAITGAVIAMAHRLNMEVVAEGVETKEQLDFLVDNHCEYAQGYIFSKPKSLSDIRQMLAPNVRLLRQ